MKRKIFIRIAILVVIFAILDLIYTFTLFKKDLAEKSPEIVMVKNTQDSSDVYYFGESSNVTYADDDSLQNSISEFLSWHFPAMRFVNINKYATHAGIYKHWINQINTRKKLPSAIVVTMNLRSFNQQWINSDLETQLRESLVLGYPFTPLINRFLLSLQAFDNRSPEQREKEVRRSWKNTELRFPFPARYKTVKQWDDAMANGTYLKEDGTWDQEKIILACHFIKAYAFNLDQNNPRIKDFDGIVEWARRYEVPLYLNLLAENVEYADSLVGRDLLFLMRENRSYLVNRYNKDGCTVVDNLETVKGEEFIDQDWTTEHYKYRARMRIAGNIADSMKRKFNEYYQEPY